MAPKHIGYDRRRRQADRRSSERPGKYDRRKNTCETCHFYKEQSNVAGLCLKHQTMIRGDDFACIWFTPREGPESPPDETT